MDSQRKSLPAAYRTMSAILTNPCTSPGMLELVAFSNAPPDLLRRVAENPRTPRKALLYLCADNSPDVRSAIGDNPATPVDILLRLARDEDLDVRYALAENHNLPPAVLVVLSEDENAYVSVRARKTIERLAREAARVVLEVPIARPDNLTRILIAEDDDFTRSVIRLSLEAEADIAIVAEAQDGATAIEEAVRTQPHLVLMDIGLPVVDGIEATRRIKDELPAVRVVMVTARDADDDIMSALGVGADGYYLKNTNLENLVEAIRCVALGATWLDPGIASTVLRRCINEMRDEGEPKGQTQAPSAAPATEEDRLNDVYASLSSTIEEYEGSNRPVGALAVCQAAYDAARSLYGDNSEKAARFLAKLADLHFSLEEYGEAEALYLRVLELRQEFVEFTRGEADTTIEFLARIYESRRNYEQAELYYARCLRMREKLGDARLAAETRRKLNRVLKVQGKAMIKASA